jgi:hypothetical protein
LIWRQARPISSDVTIKAPHPDLESDGTLFCEAVTEALTWPNGLWKGRYEAAPPASSEQAGLEKLALEAVAGNGFVPGVTRRISSPTRHDPCKGAVPRKHSHFFTAEGRFGSRDWNGEQVDDGTYEVVDDGTFVVSKEFPDVTFRYRIDGDTIMFEPEIPDRCSTFRCLWSVAVAYPGQTWRRVS